MSDEEVGMLIFAPGFSTAEQVTDVSGRGVGMDVVKRNIQEMGGHVEIRSQAGKGTTIRILLPLTLAILDGMSVKVNDEVFILPLNAVMESLQPQAEDLHPLAGANACCRCAANICRWWSCIGYLKWKAPKPMLRRASSLSCKAPVAAMRCWWIN